MDVHNAEYGVWRPVYERHAYHNVRFDQVPENSRYGFGGSAPNRDDDYPRPLAPVDDLPPVTVITHVSQAADKLVVRGTASDNGVIRRVLVNGQEARRLAPNFVEWEVELNNPGSTEVKLSAHAEDAAGNVEKVPHTLRMAIRREVERTDSPRKGK
jgi:hypothetical protein